MNSSHKWLSAAMFCALIACGTAVDLIAQAKVAYVSTQAIRERLNDAIQGRQRIEAVTEEWKKELDEMQKNIDALETQIQNMRLIWSDTERKDKEKLLQKKRKERDDFANEKFGAGGEFDKFVEITYRNVELKISAAIKEVALTQGYDIVWDKSTQPMVYVNPRYDVTLDVMERLDIQVNDLREKYKKQLEEAPNNEEKTSKKKRRRSRTRRTDTNESDKDKTSNQEIPR